MYLVLIGIHMLLGPQALLKTAILCIGLVDLDDTRSLCEQLADTLGGGNGIGLEIVTKSSLPMGSGLGGSSILGGALLHALGVATGRVFDTSSLVHAVLKLEQMLSSGVSLSLFCRCLHAWSKLSAYGLL